jgi:type II secretory pathway pseudopilin PulG
MNKSIPILICLVLMAAAAVYSVMLYKDLAAEKEKTKLLTQQLQERILKDSAEQKRIDSASAALISVVENYKNNEPAAMATDTKDSAVTKLIRSIKNSNVNYIKRNNTSAYDKALQLEKEAFNDIIGNRFAAALSKFYQIEKITPSFHSSYEIAKLLEAEKNNFANPDAQLRIKNEILKKYSWEAPKEQLKTIANQIKERPKAAVQKLPTDMIQQNLIDKDAVKQMPPDSQIKRIDKGKSNLNKRPVVNYK